MKFYDNHLRSGNPAGFTLIECMVYIAAFLILSAVAMGSFFLCWDHSKALISGSDDIRSALLTGERWRADIRQATGSIAIETNASGEVVKIPEGEQAIYYRFESGKIFRQVGTLNLPVLLLPTVKSSGMKQEIRGGVTACRWELELVQRRKEIHTPLKFTFEAVPKAP